jgi:hypothetical protein
MAYWQQQINRLSGTTQINLWAGGATRGTLIVSNGAGTLTVDLQNVDGATSYSILPTPIALAANEILTVNLAALGAVPQALFIVITEGAFSQWTGLIELWD